MNTMKRSRRLGATIAGAVAATLVSAAVLTAHDFWLVPNALTFAPGASLEVLGQSGSSFPKSGGATQPAQVAEARIVGRSSDDGQQSSAHTDRYRSSGAQSLSTNPRPDVLTAPND